MQQVGKYQLIRKLATGGMAEVFLAKAAGPMGFEKTLVLKRILPHLAEEPAFVQMFLTEAKLAARLTHPHIVQIFDFGEADGAYFLAMEYIDGPSLRSLIKDTTAKGQVLPPELCARLISHACEGLAFAHDFMDPESGEAQGLIHRDISPDNILLSRQGAVKVVDFGIAKAAGQSHKTESGVIKGKLAYMPPEQLRAKPLDRRVDVYALGVVLYELLTGRKPYVSDSDVGLMQATIFEEPTPAAQLRPGLPTQLSRILEKALAKEREHRYPDCHAFQSDLEEFIVSVGRPVTTQQVAQLIVRATSKTELPTVPPNLGEKHARLGHTEAATTLTTKVERPSPGANPMLALLHAPTPPPSSETSRHRRWLGWLGALAAGVLLVGGTGLVVQRRSVRAPAPVSPAMAMRPALIAAPPAPAPFASAVLSIEDAGTRPETTVAEASKDASARLPESAQASAEPVVPREPAREESDPKRPIQGTRKSVQFGTLELHTQPDTMVAVDGKERGKTPLPRLKLTAGVHHIQLTNDALNKFWFDTFKIELNQINVLEVDLRKY